MPLLWQQDVVQATHGLYQGQGKMKCSATVVAEGDSDKIIRCFAPEETKFDRSSFTIEKVDGGVRFNIESNDAVALRATLNTISQLLTVYEGAEGN